jgi:hypothetical protein
MSKQYPGGIISKTAPVPTQVAASGVWTLDQQAYWQKLGQWPTPGYKIARSLRFNSADSAYLSRTLTTPTSNTTWSFSFWLKRSTLSTQQYFLNVDSYSGIGTNSDSIVFWSNAGATLATSTAVFRDVSAWYHVVVVSNGTTITAYVNNSSVLSYTGTITNLNSAVVHNIGRDQTSNSAYLNGYMTEVNFIDGQALTPSSFGETNSQTGVWSPMPYTGAYGTNGFYLNFSDNSNTTAATLGKDYSGNGNNWTPNGFLVSAGVNNDSLVDSPTSYGVDTGAGGNVGGNYATLNGASVGTDATLTNGNLDIAYGSSTTRNATMATIGMSSGKWYWEVTITASSVSPTNAALGITNNASSSAVANYPGFSSNGWGYLGDGTKYNSATGIAYGSSFTTNDVIGFTFDADVGSITAYKNGVSLGVMYSSLAADTYFPAIGDGAGTATFSASFNFGQRPFAYTAPSGFKALCTQNLPTPTIGATTATQAGKFFNIKLYTGNGSAGNAQSGLGFQPDFLWFKSRSAARSHGLFNAVMTRTFGLASESTTSEYTSIAGRDLASFDSDGFTVGVPENFNSTNASGDSIVAWAWKANGSGSSNTAGSITSTVSANTTSGFSVVTYVGVASSPVTIGHGLGVAPNFIIVKNRSTTSAWYCYHSSLGANARISLNLADAAFTSTGLWNGTAPSSTVFTTVADTTTNNTGSNHIAYCFAPIAGYSAFGSYTGNGSPDGPFVFTGFRPAFIMIKRTDTGASDWQIIDTTRDVTNVAGYLLQPNASNAESNATPVLDFLSNGFKNRNTYSVTNATAATYIYAAFATSPFKYSLAR